MIILKKMNNRKQGYITLLLFFLMITASQIKSQNYQPTPNDTLKSVTILADGKISFKIYAPMASEVRLGGTDIPVSINNSLLKKRENGIWEIIVGPVESGAYRYNFMVDKIAVIDPRNPVTSESNMNTWSLIYVPGADFMDIKDIPHGAISEVTYFSESLHRFRRMHIYTPPGYESGDGKYPIFYLLHGAFDCDNSWSTVGRARFILDNLIAEKRAVPMVIVMPAGHTEPFSFSSMLDSSRPMFDEFVEEFNKDIKPFVENHYRVYTDRKSRAVAGLSMGGWQTINIGIPNLAEFAYLGVFSSGIFGITGTMFGNNKGPSWEDKNKVILSDDKLKDDLKLIWFATGKDDFLLETSRASVALLKKYGFDVTYKESEGGHTWKNWREYLNEFAQLLFK